jgi:hypothetical protein
LLNIVEGILPSGPEQWKIVALNYQQAAKEDFLRYYDDVRRHFIDKLCKKMQRQTGLNNKSGPTPAVARAQLIHRKILVNEAAVTAGGDNEAEDMEEYEDAVNDDENEEEDDDKEDDFQPSTTAIEERSSNAPPKRKERDESFDDMKTKNSKPRVSSNPRGGIAGTLNGLVEVVRESTQSSMLMKMMEREQMLKHYLLLCHACNHYKTYSALEFHLSTALG